MPEPVFRNVVAHDLRETEGKRSFEVPFPHRDFDRVSPRRPHLDATALDPDGCNCRDRSNGRSATPIRLRRGATLLAIAIVG